MLSQYILSSSVVKTKRCICSMMIDVNGFSIDLLLVGRLSHGIYA